MIYVLLCVFFGIATALVARAKGSTWWLWGIIGACFPILGLVAVLLYRSERDELRRQCPECGALRPISDAMCLKCGAELDFPDVAIESEAAADRARQRAPAH